MIFSILIIKILLIGSWKSENVEIFKLKQKK